jgi:hypothetical protein
MDPNVCLIKGVVIVGAIITTHQKLAASADGQCASRAPDQFGDDMKRLMFSRKASEYMVAGALMVFALYPGRAQAQDVAPAQVPDASVTGGQRQREADDPWTAQQKRDMLKKQNGQRQQDIKKDTDQLLDLATELKQYVDKTNENIISLDVIKKAEQIEKLAKSVKEKMKGGN